MLRAATCPTSFGASSTDSNQTLSSRESCAPRAMQLTVSDTSPPAGGRAHDHHDSTLQRADVRDLRHRRRVRRATARRQAWQRLRDYARWPTDAAERRAAARLSGATPAAQAAALRLQP